MRCSCRRRPLLTAAVVALLCGPGTLWAKPHDKQAARDQSVALENLWVKAQAQGDVAAMDKLLSPDFLGITMTGEVVTKTQQMDRMRTRTLVIRSMQISDLRVKLLGQDAASVTSLAQLDGTSEGTLLTGRFRYIHVYKRLANGIWSITNFEATRIPGGKMGLRASPAADAPVTPP